MTDQAFHLLSILDLEPIEVNLFRGVSPKTSWQRVFGGQVIGQAMVAACRTVETRLPHSLHCYFILPGDPKVPIIYQVERLRDGGSYSTRRVSAIFPIRINVPSSTSISCGAFSRLRSWRISHGLTAFASA